MKFLPLSEFEDVTSALNFDTEDCHVVGGCDLYTTKAAGGDKKLYKNIENSLESQYESLLRLSASLSPPNASHAAQSLNLSRSSPFGPLSEHSSRRTFAYLIATLNASHPDYDFSHLLRPSDFRRERSLKRVMNTIDTTLFNLRPRLERDVTPPLHATSSGSHPTVTAHSWGPRMWKIIDDQMFLKEKRVCYIYLRGISILSGPADGTTTPSLAGKRYDDDGFSTPDYGARKRARYWLGDRASLRISDSSSDENESSAATARPSRPIVDEYDNYLLSDEDTRSRSRSKSSVRAMSEEIADAMEV
ncbi:predicted protein [Histoplasma mississippiense (nom. inval.)]|uniref:predicted protein n=1 Tax=Ajellomyces capsulatus (strain NAm1 / WU24) TaxID=2059318 RepID=UPI000157B8A1|nr:predicted protein [Histoplasma mississippiense (nom. inval.)]EDN03291.1 predicted protein [Histoplasma mississippiense (nom. inval.)]